MKTFDRAQLIIPPTEFERITGVPHHITYEETFFRVAAAICGLPNEGAALTPELLLEVDPSQEGRFDRNNPGDVAILVFDSIVHVCGHLIHRASDLDAEINTTIRNVFCGPAYVGCYPDEGVTELAYADARGKLERIVSSRRTF